MKLKRYDKESSLATIEQRNRIFLGEEIEIFGPGSEHMTQTIDYMIDEEGNEIEVAPHPQQIIKIRLDQPAEKFFLLRKAK